MGKQSAAQNAANRERNRLRKYIRQSQILSAYPPSRQVQTICYGNKGVYGHAFGGYFYGNIPWSSPIRLTGLIGALYMKDDIKSRRIVATAARAHRLQQAAWG